MRRLIVVGVSVVLVVLGTVPAAAKGKPQPPNPIALKNEQIAVALLGLSDMPTGWAVVPLPASDTQASATNGYCNGPNEKARAEAANDVAAGLSSFAQDPKNGPMISETMYAFPTVADAQAFLAATQSAVSSCTSGWQTASSLGSEITVSWTASALSFPKITDQVLGVRQQGTNMFQGQAGASGVIDVATLRKGNHVLSVERFGTAADPAQLQQYAQAALNKFGVELAAVKKTQRRGNH
jgi:hypothetical protein